MDLLQPFIGEAKRLFQKVKNGLSLALNYASPSISRTPADVIYQRNKMRLLRYEPVEGSPGKVPILLVPSLVNRHYILDLLPGRSVADWLRKASHPVYLIDWGAPGPEDRWLDLHDYIEGLLHRAVQMVRRDTHSERIHLMGYCMGGTLALIYGALHPSENISLILLATPVDFSQGGLLRLWSQPQFFDAETFVDAYGNAPAEILQAGFSMLKPAWQVRQYWDLWKYLWNDDYVSMWRAMSRWVNDNVPLAGEVFKEFAMRCFQENRLYHGRLRIRGKPARLDALRSPVLNIMARYDHIVPVEASACLKDLATQATVKDILFNCGHIGITVGGRAFIDVWPQIDRWMTEAFGTPA